MTAAVVQPVGERIQKRTALTLTQALDEDLKILARLLNLVSGHGAECQGSLESITQTICHHFSAKTVAAAEKAAHALRNCIRLLRDCGFTRYDIEVTIAHATSYFSVFRETLRREGKSDVQFSREFANIFCVLVYLAHSHIDDNTIPLRHWHEYIFVRYCTLHILNAAIVGTMKKLDYKLRVKPAELTARIERLQEVKPDSTADNEEADDTADNEKDDSTMDNGEADSTTDEEGEYYEESDDANEEYDYEEYEYHKYEKLAAPW